jgi:hypothetical protein
MVPGGGKPPARQQNIPTYFDEVKTWLEKMPRSFVALKVSQKKQEEDPPCFSITIENGVKCVWFPKELPDDRRESILPAISKLVAISKSIGDDVQIVSTERECPNSLWNLLETLDNALSGVIYCLEGDDNKLVTPVNNVPSDLKRGWDFALWYSFAAGAKTNDYNDGFSIHRVVSLLSADQGRWSEKGGTYAEIDRVSTIVRQAAQSHSKHMAPIAKFLKAKGYFTNKLVGKKPIPGLYTSEELSHLQAEWTARLTAVGDKYDQLPKEFSDILPGQSLNNYLTKLAVPLSPDTKLIEDAKTQRIPHLLFEEGRGRSSKKSICKGNDLHAKLITLEGGSSVRTIAKILWSPFTDKGFSQQDFATATIAEARSRNLRDEVSYLEEIEQRDRGKKSPLPADIRAIFAHRQSIASAAQTYLEVIPDRLGQPAWDATFGVHKA